MESRGSESEVLFYSTDYYDIVVQEAETHCLRYSASNSSSGARSLTRQRHFSKLNPILVPKSCAKKNGIIRGRRQTSSRCDQRVMSLSRLQGAVAKSLEGRAVRACRLRELGCAEDLLHAILLLVKGVVYLGHVLDADAVGDHLQGVDLAFLDHLEKLLPVEVDGCLSVADKTNTALHQ